MLERLKRLFDTDRSSDGEATLADPPLASEDHSQDDFNEITSLSWDLRVQCFIGCICLSVICSLAGNALLFTWRVTGFTVMVSLGSILSLIGTCFLMGPLKQLQKMFERGRFLASLMYISAIILTISAGLILSNPPLALIAVVCQYIAMAWYSMTYIPFAQEVVSSMCCGCFN